MSCLFSGPAPSKFVFQFSKVQLIVHHLKSRGGKETFCTLARNEQMTTQLTHSKDTDDDQQKSTQSKNADLISLKIIFANGKNGLDYTTITTFGQLPWDVHRLLWIGYHKNVDNEKCGFSKLSKDIMNCIIKFFLIDDSTFIIEKFHKGTTFNQITNKYKTDLDSRTQDYISNHKDLNGRHFVCVHVWCQFGAIKQYYPVDEKIKITPQEFDNINLKKWVEMPDDIICCRRPINDKMMNFGEYNRICIEFICTRDKDDDKDDKNTGNGLIYTTKLYWPLSKPDSEWKNFDLSIGDILDVIARKEIWNQSDWYESVVRSVKIDGDGSNKNGKKMVAVHVVGWDLKWDKWIEIEPKTIKKRHSETKGPYRSEIENVYAVRHSTGLVGRCLFWKDDIWERRCPGWQRYIEAISEVGFSKVAIILRTNYQCLATTNRRTDCATAYIDQDNNAINENQELLDDWNDSKKVTFSFFGEKQRIILRDKDESFIVCQKGQQVLLAREFKTIWVIAYGSTKLRHTSKGDYGFKSAQDALKQVSQVWGALAEAGI